MPGTETRRVGRLIATPHPRLPVASWRFEPRHDMTPAEAAKSVAPHARRPRFQRAEVRGMDAGRAPAPLARSRAGTINKWSITGRNDARTPN
jgi:hypothetical protein